MKKKRKFLKKLKKKYEIAIKSEIRYSLQKLIREKDIQALIKQFDIIFYLKKLENHPEINTRKAHETVNRIFLEILNKELFISQFEWKYKLTNKLWKKEFNWFLFRKNDFFSIL